MSDSTAMGKTGFVGLGNMGGPMARNLLKAGVKLVVHDIDARKVQALSAAGAEVAATPQAVARRPRAPSAWSRPPPRPRR
ncbi:NAD(P)-binding domain-containing protein [Siccirubricoccus deserti]